MSDSSHILGTSRASDGDFHVRDLTEQRVADFIDSRHGKRPKSVVWVEQIHSTGYYFVEKGEHGMLGRGDALSTNQPDVCLTIRTADCVPVFLLGQRAVGLLHAGMAGAVQGILPQVAFEFAKRYGEDVSTTTVHLGPHICQKCYKMSENNLRFLRGFPAAEKFLRKRGTGQYFSLAEILTDQANRIGITAVNVDSGCTLHDDDYFSSRRGHDHRLLSYIVPHA